MDLKGNRISTFVVFFVNAGLPGIPVLESKRMQMPEVVLMP
jgi:hypothetical protein